jgi:hypothetical protein
MELKPNRSRDTKMKNTTTSQLLRQCLAILGAALLCLPATSRLAVTINVTSTADSGTGTLRAALASAANGDIINAKGVSGTILLTNGQLMVSNSVTILGPGPGKLAVNGNYPNITNRVFYINPGLIVTIAGLTITNGYAQDATDDGGGILNDRSTLTVSNCVFSGNQCCSGGGIYNNAYEGGSATLLVSSCAFSNNSAAYGGGLFNEAGFGSASAWVNNSTFSGNIGGSYGGAIVNDGISTTNATLVVSNCTFGSNSTGGAGGAIANYDFGTVTAINSTFTNNQAFYGGALYIDGGYANATITVNNCTISGNSAQFSGGGLFSQAHNGVATTRVLNSTISGNSILDPNGGGGGIYNDGRYYTGAPLVVVLNSTLSGNSGANGGGIYNAATSGSATLNIGSTILKTGGSGASLVNDAGVVTSLGYNLSSDNGGGWLTNTTDQINTDPKLGPLQNNGGPTFTHVLSMDSPALDKGKNLAGSPTDQRGSARIVDLCIANALGGDGSDIGAFELLVTIPTGTLTVLNTNDSGAGSLREAIALANFCPDTNTIVFAPSAYGIITLTSGELPITAPLSIVGPGPTNVVISGNAASRVFYVGPNLNVTIAGLTIANGTNVNGGGIQNDHSILTVSNCTLSGNAANFGGGIHNNGDSGSAVLSVSACTFSRNSASDWGGGIYNDGESYGSATLKVLSSTFSANLAYLGGGIENDGFYGSAALSVNASTFSGNSTIYSTGLGGDIYNDDTYGTATLQIGDTILSAGALGGTLQGGTVTSLGYNLSSDNGGGLLTASTDQINTDPKLGPLQNNGGPTFTHALLPGSPAIDKGKRDAIASLAVSADQRGFSRPLDFSSIPNASGGDGSDIGAFEVQILVVGTPMLLASPQKLLNGSFQFSFTNTPGASFSVLTTTDVALPLSNWTVLGTPAEISPGHFQYADPQATNQPRRFYGVRSP